MSTITMHEVYGVTDGEQNGEAREWRNGCGVLKGGVLKGGGGERDLPSRHSLARKTA